MKRWSWVLALGVLVVWLGLGVLVLRGAVLPHFERSDIAFLYRARNLYTHGLPYFQLRIEYPVVLGWWMWATAWVPGPGGYLAANVLGLSLAAAGITVLVHRLRPAFHQWWTVFPLLSAFAFVNWDLLGILAMVGAWDAWTRERSAWTGVWLAVGTATKLFPVIAWPFMAYAWWRDGRRHDARRMTVWAVAVWVALNAPEMLGAWRNWSWFWVFNFTRSSSTDLFWLLHLNHALGRLGIDGLSLFIVGGATVWALRRMAAGWGAPAATAAVMAAFFIVNKVFSPQYMLWMAASGVLAGWTPATLGLLTLGGIGDWATHFAALQIPGDIRLGAIRAARTAAVGVVAGVAARYGVLVLALMRSREPRGAREAPAPP